MAKQKKPRKRQAVPEQTEVKPVVIYTELPRGMESIKDHMTALARRHNRKLTGEVIQALQEYLARHKLWPPSNEPEKDTPTNN